MVMGLQMGNGYASEKILRTVLCIYVTWSHFHIALSFVNSSTLLMSPVPFRVPRRCAKSHVCRSRCLLPTWLIASSAQPTWSLGWQRATLIVYLGLLINGSYQSPSFQLAAVHPTDPGFCLALSGCRGAGILRSIINPTTSIRQLSVRN